MKVFKLSILTLAFSSTLSAAEIDDSLQIGIFGDYIKSSTNKENQMDWQRIEAGKSIGIDLHKIINDSWNIRFEIARTRYQINNGNDTDYGNRIGIDGVYKLEDSNLYLFSGIRRFNNIKDYNVINVGAGFDYEISDRLSLYSEAAIYKDIDFGYVDQGFKLGLKYSFGETKSAPVVSDKSMTAKESTLSQADVKTVDSDNDGIADDMDRCLNTPAMAKVDSFGCALYAENEVSVTLKVMFDHNSDMVKPSSIDEIQRLADFMTTYKNTDVVIEGHTSSLGAADYNQKLSEKRANKVKDILIKQFNIDESRLSAKGYGESRLLSKGKTIADHAMNRRVVAAIETVEKSLITK